MKRNLILALVAFAAVIVTAVTLVTTTVSAADPTLRDFPDAYESRITDPKTGWGLRNVKYLGGMLDALYDEVMDAHRRVSCLGGVDVANRAALTALVKADLATALADADCSNLYVTVTDDGNGDPKRYRYDSASTATATDHILATDEGGAGRWYAVDVDIAASGLLPASQTFLAAAADRVAGDDSGATTGSGLEFTNKYGLTSADLAVGQSYRIRAGVVVVGQNGTDTLTLTMFIGGTSGLDIADIAAYDAADDDVLTFDIVVTVVATGASGSVTVHGTAIKDTGGTSSLAGANAIAETVDLTGDPDISIAAKWGSSSATNEADLRFLEVTAIPAP